MSRKTKYVVEKVEVVVADQLLVRATDQSALVEGRYAVADGRLKGAGRSTNTAIVTVTCGSTIRFHRERYQVGNNSPLLFTFRTCGQLGAGLEWKHRQLLLGGPPSGVARPTEGSPLQGFAIEISSPAGHSGL